MSGIRSMWSATLVCTRGILHFLKWGELSLMGVVRDSVGVAIAGQLGLRWTCRGYLLWIPAGRYIAVLYYMKYCPNRRQWLFYRPYFWEILCWATLFFQCGASCTTPPMLLGWATRACLGHLFLLLKIGKGAGGKILNLLYKHHKRFSKNIYLTWSTTLMCRHSVSSSLHWATVSTPSQTSISGGAH